MEEPTTQAPSARTPAWLAALPTRHLKVLARGYQQTRERCGVLCARDRAALAELHAEIDRRRDADDTPVVVYRRDRSTPWTDAYDAASRSRPGTVWRVTHDERTGRWFCGCPATVAACAHIKEAWRVGRSRWWAAIWRAADDATLRDERARRGARLECGEFDADERVAWDELLRESAARGDARAA